MKPKRDTKPSTNALAAAPSSVRQLPIVRNHEELAAAAQEYRILANERGGGPLSELSVPALVGHALGADLDGDPVESMLTEVETRLRILRSALRGDPGLAGDSDLEVELYALERRTAVACELLRRQREEREEEQRNERPGAA